MGLFGRKKLRERWIRADYRSRPEEEWTDDEYDHFTKNATQREYWEHWERWSQRALEHPTVKSIRRGALEMAAESAKHSFPHEFGSMLRVEKGVVTEIVLVPGTIQGDRHAIFQFYMLPVDRTIRGTLHSHPSPHPYPSDDDFALFEKYGTIHVIYGHPYGPNDWRAYDHTGTPTRLDVVDE
ncbi:MAG: Mov34/MPN/PAD-1 family protein [Thermoplasmatota archaeon]